MSDSRQSQAQKNIKTITAIAQEACAFVNHSIKTCATWYTHGLSPEEVSRKIQENKPFQNIAHPDVQITSKDLQAIRASVNKKLEGTLPIEDLNKLSAGEGKNLEISATIDAIINGEGGNCEEFRHGSF
jgi:hypothetical protein